MNTKTKRIQRIQKPRSQKKYGGAPIKISNIRSFGSNNKLLSGNTYIHIAQIGAIATGTAGFGLGLAAPGLIEASATSLAAASDAFFGGLYTTAMTGAMTGEAGIILGKAGTALLTAYPPALIAISTVGAAIAITKITRTIEKIKSINCYGINALHEYLHCKYGIYKKADVLYETLELLKEKDLDIFKTRHLKTYTDILELISNQKKFGIFIPSFFINIHSYFESPKTYVNMNLTTLQSLFMTNEMMTQLLKFNEEDNLYHKISFDDDDDDTFEHELKGLAQYINENIYSDFYLNKIEKKESNWKEFIFYFITRYNVSNTNKYRANIKVYEKTMKNAIQNKSATEIISGRFMSNATDHTMKQKDIRNVDFNKNNETILTQRDNIGIRATLKSPNNDKEYFVSIPSDTYAMQKKNQTKHRKPLKFAWNPLTLTNRATKKLYTVIKDAATGLRSIDIFFNMIREDLHTEYVKYIHAESKCFQLVSEKINTLKNVYNRYSFIIRDIENSYTTIEKNFEILLHRFYNPLITLTRQFLSSNNNNELFSYFSTVNDMFLKINSTNTKISASYNIIDKLKNENNKKIKTTLDKHEDLYHEYKNIYADETTNVEEKKEQMLDKGILTRMEEISTMLTENINISKTIITKVVNKKNLIGRSVVREGINVDIYVTLDDTAFNFKKIYSYLNLIYKFLNIEDIKQLENIETETEITIKDTIKAFLPKIDDIIKKVVNEYENSSRIDKITYNQHFIMFKWFVCTFCRIKYTIKLLNETYKFFNNSENINVMYQLYKTHDSIFKPTDTDIFKFPPNLDDFIDKSKSIKEGRSLLGRRYGVLNEKNLKPPTPMNQPIFYYNGRNNEYAYPKENTLSVPSISENGAESVSENRSDGSENESVDGSDYGSENESGDGSEIKSDNGFESGSEIKSVDEPENESDYGSDDGSDDETFSAMNKKFKGGVEFNKEIGTKFLTDHGLYIDGMKTELRVYKENIYKILNKADLKHFFESQLNEFESQLNESLFKKIKHIFTSPNAKIDIQSFTRKIHELYTKSIFTNNTYLTNIYEFNSTNLSNLTDLFEKINTVEIYKSIILNRLSDIKEKCQFINDIYIPTIKNKPELIEKLLNYKGSHFEFKNIISYIDTICDNIIHDKGTSIISSSISSISSISSSIRSTPQPISADLILEKLPKIYDHIFNNTNYSNDDENIEVDNEFPDIDTQINDDENNGLTRKIEGMTNIERKLYRMQISRKLRQLHELTKLLSEIRSNDDILGKLNDKLDANAPHYTSKNLEIIERKRQEINTQKLTNNDLYKKIIKLKTKVEHISDDINNKAKNGKELLPSENSLFGKTLKPFVSPKYIETLAFLKSIEIIEFTSLKLSVPTVMLDVSRRMDLSVDEIKEKRGYQSYRSKNDIKGGKRNTHRKHYKRKPSYYYTHRIKR